METPSGKSWKHPDSLLYAVDDDYVVPEEVETPKRVSLWPEWHRQARCLGTSDTLFFGSAEPETRPPYTVGEIKKARAICAECPAARLCLKAALEFREEYGVWAGTTRKQRKEMLFRTDMGITTIKQEIDAQMSRMNNGQIDEDIDDE